jgi:hypothetical protein
VFVFGGRKCSTRKSIPMPCSGVTIRVRTVIKSTTYVCKNSSVHRQCLVTKIMWGAAAPPSTKYGVRSTYVVINYGPYHVAILGRYVAQLSAAWKLHLGSMLPQILVSGRAPGSLIRTDTHWLPSEILPSREIKLYYK